MVNISGTGRYSKNFRELIEKIRDIEKNNSGIDCSESRATEIIYQRILKAGGWKAD